MNLVLLVLLLTLSEFVLRAVAPIEPYQRTYPGQHSNRSFDPNSSWSQPDDKLGWTFNRERRITSTKYKSVSYTVNKLGFRESKPFHTENEATSGVKRIVVLGDSFVFGSFIDDNETIPATLQRRLGNKFSVYNLGIPGWGVDQMYLAYEEYKNILKPDITVLIYIDDDIFRAYEAYRFLEGRNKPSFNIGEGVLIERTADTAPIWEPLLTYTNVGARLSLYRRERYSKQIAELVFREIIFLAKAYDEQVYVVRIPTIDDLGCNNWLCIRRRNALSFIDFFKTTNVEYIELYDAFINLNSEQYQKLYIPNDGHLTPMGTDFVATILAEILSVSH